MPRSWTSTDFFLHLAATCFNRPELARSQDPVSETTLSLQFYRPAGLSLSQLGNISKQPCHKCASSYSPSSNAFKILTHCRIHFIYYEREIYLKQCQLLITSFVSIFLSNKFYSTLENSFDYSAKLRDINDDFQSHFHPNVTRRLVTWRRCFERNNGGSFFFEIFLLFSCKLAR